LLLRYRFSKNCLPVKKRIFKFKHFFLAGTYGLLSLCFRLEVICITYFKIFVPRNWLIWKSGRRRSARSLKSRSCVSRWSITPWKHRTGASTISSSGSLTRSDWQELWSPRPWTAARKSASFSRIYVCLYDRQQLASFIAIYKC